jgi:phospholipid/cholesterol/gamma-HCH transport system permease protein
MMIERVATALGARDLSVSGAKSDGMERLIAQARRMRLGERIDSRRPWGLREVLARLGKGAVMAAEETAETLAFLGETAAAFFRAMKHPKRLRWPATVHAMEKAGLDSMPILCTLSFFIGMVIAYMGVNLLRNFGAEVFTVELVAVAVLREFAVVITAVLLAGRTDSAFAAEIGAMKLNEEVDALKTLGLDPQDVLVLPRVIALVIMTPALTFAAMISGLVGGLLVLWTTLDMSPALALARIEQVVPLQHFWVGIIKAPLFGLVLAVVGCRHGLAVERDVTSLGARTTAAVVQSIFLVILLDAIFAIVYLELDV